MGRSSFTAGLIDKNPHKRLEALYRCVKETPRRNENGGINLHIHTNESFSVFRTPTEAVWHGYTSGIEYFGINDHYTTLGHEEFRRACEIARLKAVFSLEIKAMDERAFHEGIRVNDPNNPGRVYLVGKGVTRTLKKTSRACQILCAAQAAIRKRNGEIVESLKRYAREKGYSIDFSYADVRSLTPHGNATERHVIQAFCEKIDLLTENLSERKEIYRDILNTDIEEEDFLDISELQMLVKSRLIRSGGPCYVAEDHTAFPSVDNVVNIFREYGAVPTYPVMANPITPEEEDIEELVKKAKRNGLYAFDLFEFRTGEERAREVIGAAAHHGFPVFIGTEHNIKKMLPMIGEIGKNPEFYGYLRKSADFILGHQILSELCDFGYLTSEGEPRFSDLKEGFRFFASVGEMGLSSRQIEELKKRDPRERRRFFNL